MIAKLTFLKEQFNQNWKFAKNFQDVDEIASSSERIWGNLALRHLLSNGSSAVNGCRQNESPNSWLKHHNNPQVIHTTPVHQLTSCEATRCMFVRNESIIRMFFCFWLKYESIIHNNTLCRLNQERNMDGSSIIYKQTVQNCSKQICGWILMWEDNRDGLFHCLNIFMDYGHVFWPEARVWS